MFGVIKFIVGDLFSCSSLSSCLVLPFGSNTTRARLCLCLCSWFPWFAIPLRCLNCPKLLFCFVQTFPHLLGHLSMTWLYLLHILWSQCRQGFTNTSSTAIPLIQEWDIVLMHSFQSIFSALCEDCCAPIQTCYRLQNILFQKEQLVVSLYNSCSKQDYHENQGKVSHIFVLLNIENIWWWVYYSYSGIPSLYITPKENNQLYKNWIKNKGNLNFLSCSFLLLPFFIPPFYSRGVILFLV